MKAIGYIFGLLIIAGSCSQHHTHKPSSSAALDAARQSFKLPKDKTFRLDPRYINYLFSLDTLKYAVQIKNHYQPLQAAYYDKAGNLVSFHINCYAAIGEEGGDLKWNQHNAFDSFVPISIAPVDSIFSLTKHLSFVKTFDNQSIDTTGFSFFDYTVIVHWSSKWRPKDSKNLIGLVATNAFLAGSSRVNLLYVNSDY